MATTTTQEVDIQILTRVLESNSKIIAQLDELNLKLADVSERLSKIEKSTNNMDEHIGFVEAIYRQIQTPFHSLMNFAQTRLLN